ncbi:MAG TPA: hypothetical protein VFF18_17310 [Woeseiaceae bacterium]|nr:hypothetical protein [Woeseiaceae bacterium]
MKDNDMRADGGRTCEQDRRTPTLHVAQLPDGFHVVQVPGNRGEPMTHWSGPLENAAAAEMQRDELLRCGRSGDMTGWFSDSVVDFFDMVERFEKLIRRHNGDARSLARMLVARRPWADPKPAEPGPLPF